MEKQPKFDYSDIKFKDNGKLKLIIVVGTRPEIIRLAAVITKCRQYFDVILAHTGQNYDYNLNGIFFKDLKLAEPEVYMDAVGDDLGATCGNIINCSYKLFAQTKPDGVLVLGDTNSCLSVIGAKRLHIPIFHMEAGNRCKDECLPEETNRRIVDIISDVNMAYSEHARRYLADCGLPKERTYVTGSPMAEVLHNNLAEELKINAKSDETKRARREFSESEINLLWEYSNLDSVKIVLMLIYSGVRVSELLNLKISNVNLDEQTFFVESSKTDSGVRTVPIADKVLPFWQKFISDSQCGYVLNNTNGKPLKYDNFKRNYWTPLQNDLGLDHTIHETRHTCISMLVSANVNHTIIKKIVGHKSKMDLTEKVYTHINPKELVNAINKI